MMKEQFIQDFFKNSLSLTFNVEKAYKMLKKYIENDVFSKFPELYDVLEKKFFYADNFYFKKIYHKINGYIGALHRGPIKGLVPWNKGKTGCMPIPWNKGLTKNDDARLKNLSISRCGDKNPCSYKNKPDRTLMNIKQSETMKQKILNGNFTPKTSNRLCHIKLHYNGKNFRSSWEIVFYILNSEKYEYETKRIKYVLDGKTKIYISDFYDKETNTIFEIKPNKMMYEINKEKYEIIKNTCIKDGFNFIHIGDEWYEQIKNDKMCFEFCSSKISQEIIKKFFGCYKNEN